MEVGLEELQSKTGERTHLNHLVCFISGSEVITSLNQNGIQGGKLHYSELERELMILGVRAYYHNCK